MAKKMLIDATHPEETRVVVVQGTKLEDFDFESAARIQLIGNIYLAKVTRIEPSLQAAFVDYGGNRHGFLAFSEIHPDYYQIPVADRQALLDADAAEEQRAENADEDVDFKVETEASDDSDEDTSETDGDTAEITGVVEIVSDVSDDPDVADDPDVKDESDGSGSGSMMMAASERDSISSEPLEDTGEASADDSDMVAEIEGVQSVHPADDAPEALSSEAETSTPSQGEPLDGEQPAGEQSEPAQRVRRSGRRRRSPGKAEPVVEEARQDGDWEDGAGKRIESVGGGDVLDEVSRPRARRRQYKIQEVIKKRQIMLVQILKDERGSKGAALTTYLSIPGRYCVLMPNTARGGGISRKITNAVDRKRLKAVAAELDVPEGMGLIIRTAGANRTKAEIKRDFDYLLRQWETIRELTLRSTAPCLINEEGSIVKRAVRDLYDKDIEIIQVEGDASYREAKDFMRMLMPSHAKRVQPYRDPVPLFQRYQVEAQLDSMFDPTVRLKSGGYIVINPTEALVSIDVNSGKATREANIEATALRTNLEAAEEVARQLRLRDLAGLIVIDFIDMENMRNNKAVERKVKDCLASDRANIQIGRISPFGLLEMSRQRLRQGVVETTTRPCSNCHGTGLVRSVDSLALRVLRAIEEECLRRQQQVLDIYVPGEVAIFILNQKRQWLHQIEARTACSIFVIASDTVQPPNFEIKQSDRIAIIPPPLNSAPVAPEVVEQDEADDLVEAADEPVAQEQGEKREREHKRRRGRARGDETRKARPQEDADTQVSSDSDANDVRQEAAGNLNTGPADEEVSQRKTRRRRRGRGRNRDGGDELQTQQAVEGAVEDVSISDPVPSGEVLIIPILSSSDATPEAPESDIQRPVATDSVEPQEAVEPAESREEEVVRTSEEPSATEHGLDVAAALSEVAEIASVPALEPEAAPSPPEPAEPPQVLPDAPAGPKRGGWWQRQFGKT